MNFSGYGHSNFNNLYELHCNGDIYHNTGFYFMNSVKKIAHHLIKLYTKGDNSNFWHVFVQNLSLSI